MKTHQVWNDAIGGMQTALEAEEGETVFAVFVAPVAEDNTTHEGFGLAALVVIRDEDGLVMGVKQDPHMLPGEETRALAEYLRQSLTGFDLGNDVYIGNIN